MIRLILMTCLCGAVALVLASPLQAGTSDLSPLPVDILEARIFIAVNKVRRSNNLPPLKPAADLHPLAEAQCRDMAEKGYLGHTDSRGRDLTARVREGFHGSWREVAENLARGTGVDRDGNAIVEGWLRSSAHRESMLDGTFLKSAVAVTKGADGYLYATQLFLRE